MSRSQKDDAQKGIVFFLQQASRGDDSKRHPPYKTARYAGGIRK